MTDDKLYVWIVQDKEQSEQYAVAVVARNKAAAIAVARAMFAPGMILASAWAYPQVCNPYRGIATEV